MPATQKQECVGLWLDQSGATIVTLKSNDADPVVRHVESGVESHFRLSGGWKAGTQTQEVSNEKRIDRRRAQQLDRYYERLAEMLGDARRILILGPGEAKLGLERALKAKRGSKPHRFTVKTADKMTENQLVADVRRFFAGNA
jgi:hypothetical protein